MLAILAVIIFAIAFVIRVTSTEIDAVFAPASLVILGLDPPRAAPGRARRRLARAPVTHQPPRPGSAAGLRHPGGGPGLGRVWQAGSMTRAADNAPDILDLADRLWRGQVPSSEYHPVSQLGRLRRDLRARRLRPPWQRLRVRHAGRLVLVDSGLVAAPAVHEDFAPRPASA